MEGLMAFRCFCWRSWQVMSFVCLKFAELFTQITTTNMKRKQNRLPNQLRAMEAQLGLLTNADGSAKYKQGESSVLAAVYGPAEVKPREELGDRATVNVVFKKREGKPGRQEKEFEKLLRSSLESIIMTHLHPRTAITIIVQVLVDDGSVI
jgi:ribonuclease PH